MRNKWTRVGKALLCLTLAASMLAGCGGGGGSSSSSGAAESSGSGEASTSSAASTPDENFNETGLPIVNEQVELTFLYVKGANMADFEENAMFQQMEKDTNVKINWQYAGDADWSEQKSLLLASGDLPDVFFGSNSLKDMDIATNLELFIPLEDYVEKYCPNIQAAWEAEPTMEKMVTNPDGHIYTLPGKKPLRPKGCDTPFINQKWLDNLGLEMPTTVDEWYEVLKAFKEKDPNGNGVADEIPLTAAPRPACPTGSATSTPGASPTAWRRTIWRWTRRQKSRSLSPQTSAIKRLWPSSTSCTQKALWTRSSSRRTALCLTRR